jgi:hypothetical protein
LFVVLICQAQKLLFTSKLGSNLIILIGDPTDLMISSCDRVRDVTEGSTLNGVGHDASAGDSGSSNPPKLRGKHEILYGAYSEPSDPSVSTRSTISNNYKVNFSSLIDVIFQWLCKDIARTATLVSCNWPEGYNFSLKRDDMIIAHHSLLATMDYSPSNELEECKIPPQSSFRFASSGEEYSTENDVLLLHSLSSRNVLTAITSLLPSNAKIELLGSSKMRAVVACIPSGRHVFEHINLYLL